MPEGRAPEPLPEQPRPGEVAAAAPPARQLRGDWLGNGWRHLALEEALTISPNDAAVLRIEDGEQLRLVTSQGSTRVLARTSDRMQEGHISLPNGPGLDYPDTSGERRLGGVAPDELTGASDRDPVAGTPRHKSVPARPERVGKPAPAA